MSTPEAEIHFDLKGMADRGIDGSDIKSVKKQAKANAKQQKRGIDERTDEQVQPIYERANEEKRAANAGARKQAIEAKYAAKGRAIAKEGIYQATPKDERTPEMKRAHLRHVLPGRLGAALLVVAGAVVSNIDRLSNDVDLADIKLPKVGLDFGQAGKSDAAVPTITSLNKRSSGYTPDGRYYVQIAANEEYGKLLGSAKAGGHMICKKEDGSFGMIFKGLSFDSRKQAEPTRVKAKLNGYTDAWATQALDCTPGS